MDFVPTRIHQGYTQDKVQMLILEYAGEESCKGLDNIVKVKRKRSDEEDDILIPQTCRDKTAD